MRNIKPLVCLSVLATAIGLVSGAFADNFINLTTVKDDIVVTDGARLHAVLDDSGSISIAPNATVTLWMAIIQESSSMNGAGITCLGDATIILESENYICGRSRGFPAIYVPKGSTLTIKGPGKLTAIGNAWAAGIGGGEGLNCGNIVIDGGIITAKGGSSSDNGSISYITDDMIIPPDSNYKKNSIIIHPPSNDGGGPGIGAARMGGHCVHKQYRDYARGRKHGSQLRQLLSRHLRARRFHAYDRGRWFADG